MNEQLAINKQNPVIARSYDYDHFTYPWHFHREFEIIYVKESSGERFVADRTEKFFPGDLILLGSNLPHFMKSDDRYYNNDPALRVKGVVIQFADDFMSHAINNYTSFHPIKVLLDESGRGIHFPLSRNNKEIISHIEQLPEYNGIELITHLLYVLDKMTQSRDKRLLASPNYDENKTRLYNNRIAKIISFLNDHYKEQLRIETIAAEISMNTSAFCRYFREKTGKSCIEYIQDLRIGHACRLLIETSHDIFQISIECGFNTICHFNKTFKKRTGISPSEYRNKMMK